MDKEFSLIDRLKTMGNIGWNPIGLEAATEIERLLLENEILSDRIICLEAALKTLSNNK